VVFSQDPGQSGVTEFTESAKKLIIHGIKVVKDPMPTQNSKLTRYTPFSSACENGLVYIVESTFTKESLEHFHKENESFDGERSSRTRKDDIPDACASAFNWLCKARIVKLVARNQSNSATLASKALGNNYTSIGLSNLEKLDMSISTSNM
jgi:phage terminase large subunit-like protein